MQITQVHALKQTSETFWLKMHCSCAALFLYIDVLVLLQNKLLKPALLQHEYLKLFRHDTDTIVSSVL